MREWIFFWIFVVAVSVVFFYFFTTLAQRETLVYFRKQKLSVYAEVADNDLEREKGLMRREFLEPNRGMLFIFVSENKQSFWMKNTKIPLDIIFISGEQKIVDIKKNFEPCGDGDRLVGEQTCEIYTSRVPAKYALEANAGFVGANAVAIGDFVIF